MRGKKEKLEQAVPTLQVTEDQTEMSPVQRGRREGPHSLCCGGGGGGLGVTNGVGPKNREGGCSWRCMGSCSSPRSTPYLGAEGCALKEAGRLYQAPELGSDRRSFLAQALEERQHGTWSRTPSLRCC